MFRIKGIMCPGRAILSEDGIVRPLAPHIDHPSPVPRIRAKSLEHEIYMSLEPNCSLRDFISKIVKKFKDLNLDLKLMLPENTLRGQLKRRISMGSADQPVIKSFMDLGNLNNVLKIMFYIKRRAGANTGFKYGAWVEENEFYAIFI